jgi:hypothetical protein
MISEIFSFIFGGIIALGVIILQEGVNAERKEDDRQQS